MNGMNGTYYPNAKFPNDVNNNPMNGNNDEQGYIENFLRLNRGKMAKAYFSFPNLEDSRDKFFEGIIEYVGKDYLVMSNPNTGKWQLILLIYLNYVEFDEPINTN